MNFAKRLIYVLIFILALQLLTGCKGVDNTAAESYEDIAYDYIVDAVITNKGAAGIPIKEYKYQWSDTPRDDIRYLNTYENNDLKLIAVRFFATDGLNVWLGTVIMEKESKEIKDVHHYHVFTSGVTPVMALYSAYGKIGDEVEYDSLYGDDTFEEDYGTFTLIKQSEEFNEYMESLR